MALVWLPRGTRVSHLPLPAPHAQWVRPHVPLLCASAFSQGDAVFHHSSHNSSQCVQLRVGVPPEMLVLWGGPQLTTLLAPGQPAELQDQ